MSATSSMPADAVFLNDPSNMAGSYGTALVADVKQALDVWVTHLAGVGTLTVAVDVFNGGQNGLLADGAPTLDAVTGTLDGRTLTTSGAVYELSTGRHLGSDGSDITINVNAAYLGQEYLGSGGVPSGQYDGLSLFEHEIAHGLGFGGFTSQTGSLDADYETLWDHDLSSVGGTEVFTGANATAANGGVQVNITTLNNGEGYAHLANSYSDPNAGDLMTGLGLPMGVQRSISGVDLAILADVGAPITGMAGTITVGGPATATATVGTASSVGGITLTDTGAFTSSTLTLTVTDTAGRLAATQAGAATVVAASNGHTLSLTGSLADVRTELASLHDTVSAAGTDTVQVAAVDSFGNTGAGSLAVTTAGGAVTNAVSLPRVLSLAATPGVNGPLDAGRSVTFTLSTSGPVTVGTAGSVGLALNDGGTAAYVAAASSATSLVFTTTVAAGQNTPNLTATGLTLAGGATISSAGGGAASLVVNAATAGAATGIVVDTLAPTTPGLALAAASDTGVVGDGITAAATQTLTGTAEAGSTLTLTDGTALLGTATASSTGSWHYAASLASGRHAIGATATDTAGNVSGRAILALVIDGTAPDAPTLVLAAASDSGASDSDGITSVARPTISGMAEAGSRVVVTDTTAAGTVTLGTITASGGAWSLAAPALAQGVNILAATATDAAGNVSAASTLTVTLDTVAPATPAAPRLAAASDSGVQGDNLTDAKAQTITGTAEAGSTVTLFDNGTQLGTAVAASATGTWSIVAHLLDGVHTLADTATDAAGNVSARSAALALRIDTAAPGAPTLAMAGAAVTTDSAAAGVAGGVLAGSATPTLSGTAEAGSTVTLLEGATVVGRAVAASNGAWSATLAASLALGTTVLTATATDAAGNVSASSQALDIVLDAPSSGGAATAATPALPGLVSVPTLVTLNGAAGQAESFTANPGTNFVIVDGGAATIAASTDAAGAMTVFGNAGTISFANGGGTGTVVDNGSSALRLSGGGVDQQPGGVHRPRGHQLRRRRRRGRDHRRRRRHEPDRRHRRQPAGVRRHRQPLADWRGRDRHHHRRRGWSPTRRRR